MYPTGYFITFELNFISKSFTVGHRLYKVGKSQENQKKNISQGRMRVFKKSKNLEKTRNKHALNKKISHH